MRSTALSMVGGIALVLSGCSTTTTTAQKPTARWAHRAKPNQKTKPKSRRPASRTTHWEPPKRRKAGEPESVPGMGLSRRLKSRYQHTYVARRLKPKKWPNGARVAVALSFDIDNASGTLARGTPGSEPMTRGQYGAIDGLPRILRVLDKHNVPASFFIPAVAAALNPEMIPAIQSKKRHEIGIHGWIHENLVELNDEAKEQDLLNKSIELLTKVKWGKSAFNYPRPH